MKEIFAASLYDAVLDTLKVLPILFLAYLLVSYISHDHKHKFSHFLSKKNKASVFYASCLGCVPQCGFSSVIADLYSERKVTIGTLIAVFIATSDEALPIMVSNTNKIVDLLILIGVKVALAIIWGYAIDFAMLLFKKRSNKKVEVTYSSDEPEHHFHECGHIHTDHCEHGHEDCCVDNVFIDAIAHTFSIAIYIFVATFILNMIVSCIDISALQNFLNTNIYLQIVLASLIGLIPNCASSVLLVELYMGVAVSGQVVQILSFPALVAGLTAGAGVGLIILFARNRKHLLENLGVLLLQFLIGLISGFVVFGFTLLF